MSGGLRYESGRDMPPGMQIAAAKEFLCREAGAMLAVLQQVDVDCRFCMHTDEEVPCAEEAVLTGCDKCQHTKCKCCDCKDNSKYQWCGAEEAMRRLAVMKQK